MQNFNELNLDGMTLMTFLVVLEERSVSQAAIKLHINQPKVSYALDKLRKHFGDPLFVRSGRGIVPTEKALSLEEPVRELIERLSGLSHERLFDPRKEEMTFTIAANDHQRNIIFPEIFRNAVSQGIQLNLEFSPSGLPGKNAYDEFNSDMEISPLSFTRLDTVSSLLFTSKPRLFYDPNSRKAPLDIDAYNQARHVLVIFQDRTTSWHGLKNFGVPRPQKVAVAVPDFSSIPHFILGTDLITVAIGSIGKTQFKDLASVPAPFETSNVEMKMTWHVKNRLDPKHKWLRNEIKKVTAKYRDQNTSNQL